MTTLGVLVTAYRRDRFVPEALASLARSETLPDHLTILEDNPPYDRPPRVLDERLRSVGQTLVNAPLPRLGNMLARGIEACPTDLVAVLDDDDLFLPEKIAHVKRRFDGDPSIGFLQHGFARIGFDGRALGSRWAPRAGRVAPDLPSWRRSAGRNASSLVFRRAPMLPVLENIDAVTGGSDATLVWCALRADLGVYGDPAVLTSKRFYMTSTHHVRAEGLRVRNSFQHLLARSRPGSPEEGYVRWMLDRRPTFRDVRLQVFMVAQDYLPIRLGDGSNPVLQRIVGVY